MATTTAQHNNAVSKSLLYISSLATLPAERSQQAMFSATAPSQLGSKDVERYNNLYTRLVEALNAPAGETRGKTTDKAANSRRDLWALWFKARNVSNGEEDEDEEEEEDPNAEVGSDDKESEEEMGDRGVEASDAATAAILAQSAVQNTYGRANIGGGPYEWDVQNGIFRLYRNGKVVKYGANS